VWQTPQTETAGNTSPALGSGRGQSTKLNGFRFSFKEATAGRIIAFMVGFFP
jgi:hypothetical protein